jgi:hypothetical protein
VEGTTTKERLDKTTRTPNTALARAHTLKKKKETPKPQLPSTPDAVQETPQYSQRPGQKQREFYFFLNIFLRLNV